ncbi:unnamed protein product [Adineta steineri]|uniref:Uncharacterized protein n=1 Tax=Adineta steineri TaxID=433720 RepID=A0A818JU44_9BILA|nr:unnamed protein product [Adineta steineri]CAF3544189.1 unnamed protein product [Adineta steineri]
MLTLFLLIIGTALFQPAHQYRLSKRELTEYDLTNFIVGTCSADKTDTLIQNLCEQTLQSALMGTFPFLIYYCQTLGAEMRYCNEVNRYTTTDQTAGAKRFASRRLARSLNEDKQLYKTGQEMDIQTDLEQKLIMQMCIIKTKKSSVDMDQFCNEKLQEVQHGNYPEIISLCKSYPDFEYCQHIQSYSSSRSWPLSASSAPSIPPNINPSSAPLSVSESYETESIIDQEKSQ